MRKNDESQQESIIRVTWVGLLFNIFLVVFKILAGYFGNSRAVLADGVHSISDLVTDIAVLIGVRYWSAPPDSNHPYGHKRLESLVALGIGLSLVLVGVGIAWDALANLQSPQAPGGYLALVAALSSIAIKEWLFRWTLAEGKRTNSPALQASAWHHRSDAFSSIPAAVAVALSHLHPSLAICDPIGAMLVSLFIIYSSWGICKPSLAALMDQSVDEKIVNELKKAAESVPGVANVHDLRTRYLGGSASVDLHIDVNPDITVKEGHDIADAVERTLMELPYTDLGTEVVDVLVHVDPLGEKKRRNLS